MSSLELILIPSCLYAAIHDFLFYRIPNWVVLLIIGSFFLKSLVLIGMGADFGILIQPTLTFGVALIVGFMLFAFGVLGAGDAKLLAACSLWMAEINSLQFITLVSISGGILALSYIFFKNPLAFIRQLLLSKIVNNYGGITLPTNKENMVPYAVAIFAGVVWTVLK